MLEGTLIYTVYNPGCAVIVGKVVLTVFLRGAHKKRPRVRVAYILVVIEFVVAKSAFLW